MLGLTGGSTLLLDFDGTIALTIEKSPNGIGVNEAYEAAITSCFGLSAHTHYLRRGGLRNRSPREVVVELQADGHLPRVDTSQLTDRVVEMKMKSLLDEAGKRLPDGQMWPRLTPGFKPFWEAMKAVTSVYTGVLSSGHRAFIKKVFEVHELELPNILVTDDELRALPAPLSKPDPALLGVVEMAAGFIFPPDTTCYVGDDPEKDGGFARNCSFPFFHLVPAGSPLLVEPNTFDDWGTFPGLDGIGLS